MLSHALSNILLKIKVSLFAFSQGFLCSIPSIFRYYIRVVLEMACLEDVDSLEWTPALLLLLLELFVDTLFSYSSFLQRWSGQLMWAKP